jgi:hypothetical protein
MKGTKEVKDLKKILEPENWDLTTSKDKLFSSDHVIEAYFKGINEGRAKGINEGRKKGIVEGLEQGQKLVLDKLKNNIDKSGKHTSEILNYFKDQKFNPIAAYLKINSWDDFTILIVVPENEFIDPKFLPIYNYISKFESDVNEELYRLQIMICDTEGKIDDNYIKSDGFVFKHKM